MLTSLPSVSAMEESIQLSASPLPPPGKIKTRSIRKHPAHYKGHADLRKKSTVFGPIGKASEWVLKSATASRWDNFEVCRGHVST